MNEEISSIELATELTVAWLTNHNTRAQADHVPAFLKLMHDAVLGLSDAKAPLSQPEPEAQPEYKAAVTARKSLANPDHIISMIDGKPYKTLRRYLSSNGLTPDEYRQRYGLKANYPMVAPTYSEHRRSMAHRIGLGRKAGKVVEQAAEKVAAPVKQVAKRVRKGAAEAKQAAQAHLGSG